MLFGRGLIARAFADIAASDDITVFASGVSNSLANDRSATDREESLLRDALRSCRRDFVYFGTTSVYDPAASTSAYVEHKMRMESIVLEVANRALVLRLPQVVGRGANPGTLVECLYRKVLANEPIEIWSRAVRYLIDVDDVVRLAQHFLSVRERAASQIINVAVPHPISPLNILKALETATGLRANCTLINRGAYYTIDCSETLRASNYMGICTDATYPAALIERYYGGGNA